jgi:ribosomal protein L37E
MNTPLINTNQPSTIAAPKLDIKNTTEVKCEKCGGESFIESFIFRGVSAIASGTGKAGFWPINIFCCASCGFINQSFKPKELQDNKILS